jgi:hypothetical protein
VIAELVVVRCALLRVWSPLVAVRCAVVAVIAIHLVASGDPAILVAARAGRGGGLAVVVSDPLFVTGATVAVA